MIKKRSLFKWMAFSVMYVYMAIMVLAFIFCTSRKSHSVGVSMQTVQEIRFKETPVLDMQQSDNGVNN